MQFLYRAILNEFGDKILLGALWFPSSAVCGNTFCCGKSFVWNHTSDLISIL
jgi:hypothetical protein